MNRISINKTFSFEKSKDRCRGYRKRILDISQKVTPFNAGGVSPVTEF